jgi:hypothetical protein
MLCLSCSTKENKTSSTDEYIKLEQSESLETIVIDESYTLSLQLDDLESANYVLSAKIDFIDTSYIISPFSEDSIFGKFDISIEDNSNFLSQGSITETPNSIEEYEPLINDTIRTIRENTTFNKKLKVLSKEDFQVKGKIWFILESLCTPEEIEFTISSNSGVMKMEKIKKRLVNTN